MGAFPGFQADTVEAPVNLTLPVITGSAVEDQTLVTTTGLWTTPVETYSFQWKAGGVAISGATEFTCLLTDAEVGETITCTVTAANSSGSNSATSAATASVTGNNPPGDVTDLVANDISSSAIELTYTPATGADYHEERH